MTDRHTTTGQGSPTGEEHARCRCGIALEHAAAQRHGRCHICRDLSDTSAPLRPAPHKPKFSIEKKLLQAPRVRRTIGNLMRGWSGNRAARTIDCRHVDLHHFAAFILHEDVPAPKNRDNIRSAIVVLGLLRAGHAQGAVSEYIEARREHDAASTIIRRVKTLRSWARHLYERGISPRNLDALPTPTPDDLHPVRHDNSDTDNTSEFAELQRLSQEAKTRARQFIDARNQTIESLLAHSTLDRPRLMDLDWGAVDFAQHLSIDDDTVLPARIRVPGRDGRSHWRHLGPRATRTLRHWSRVYTGRFGATLPDRPVVTTLRGERLSQSWFYEIADG